MSDSQEKFPFEDKMLSLIDVSLEDDCLYNPPQDHQNPYFTDNQKEHTTVQFLDVQAPGVSLQEDELVIQRHESIEQEKTRKNEKYNLRKSLAWNSAFFTSAGVLEPEELSNMIGGSEKGSKSHRLLGIEEDIQNSTDSISTLATENSMFETLEDDLLADARASMKKSNKASSAAISCSKTGPQVNEGQLVNSSEKVGTATQNRLKTKASPKKSNVIIKGSGKLTNHISPNQQASKSASIKRESVSSLCKPPKIVGRVSPILTTTTTKRASLGANCAKREKESSKNSNGHSYNPRKLTGREAKLLALGGCRNTVPKPKPPLKSSLRPSVASKMELTTSSSIDISGSLSSDSSSKLSFDTVKRKIDPKTGNHSSIGLTTKTSLRTTSKDKNLFVNSRLSPCLKSMAKPSSAASPSSSMSEWSLESSSPTSSLNKGSSSSRPSLDTDSKDASDSGDASQALDFQNRTTDKCSIGHGTQVTRLSSEAVKRVSARGAALVHLDPIRTSGLRMPSPKIGFFDGVRSTVRTPSGSLQSPPPVPSGLLRHGAAKGSSRGGSNETKLRKHQPARADMAVRRTKTGMQQPAFEIKPLLPLEPSNAAPKVCASRNGKYSPDTPLRVQNRIFPVKSGQSSLKAEKIAQKKCNAAINNSDIGYGEWNNNLHKDNESTD